LQPGWSLRVGFGSLLYGGIIEVIQPSFGRDAEWLDFVANGIGIVAGLILGTVLRRLALRLRAHLA
jgi:VanZ family protein